MFPDKTATALACGASVSKSAHPRTLQLGSYTATPRPAIHHQLMRRVHLSCIIYSTAPFPSHSRPLNCPFHYCPTHYIVPATTLHYPVHYSTLPIPLPRPLHCTAYYTTLSSPVSCPRSLSFSELPCVMFEFENFHVLFISVYFDRNE